MAKINLTDISSGYTSLSTYNANNVLIESAIENTLSRDGTSPNSMNATLDMNSHRVTNLPDAVANQEPVTLAQAASIAGVTNPLTKDTVAAILYPRTDAEINTSITPTDFSYLPLNVRRYGAVGDGVTDDYQAIVDAITVSDNAYFNGQPFLIYFPNVAGTGGRYMVSQTLIVNRNGHCWIGDAPARRSHPSAIALTAAAAPTLLLDYTGEAPHFHWLSFEGFSGDDKATKLIELHPNPRLPTAAEISARGLDSGTLYNFEDVDAEFNNCNFQFSTAALHTYGRGLYVDTCEIFQCDVGIDLDREAVFQRGADNNGQDQDTGLRGFAIRNTRFHGMGTPSAAVRNIGTYKDDMGGLEFTGNLLDTSCSVMYGPMKNSNFDCTHTAIRAIVFDAHTTTGLGDASGTYENISINGIYNSWTLQNQNDADVDSTLDAAVVATDVIIPIASTTNFTVGKFVHIELDTGQYHKGEITSINSGVSVTLIAADAMPSGAASGNDIDQSTPIFSDNFLYADGGKNISIDANVRDIFKDVIRFDGAVDTFSMNGTFYDVMQDGASTWYSLVKLNGAAFTNITVAGSLQTDAGLTASPSVVAAVGSFTIQGMNLEGLSFDPTEWVPFSSGASVSPWTSTDATPSMMGRKYLVSAGTTAITDFDDGEVGDTLLIKCGAADITITNNAALILAGGANYDMKTATGDTLTLTMFADQVWTEVSRSVN